MGKNRTRKTPQNELIARYEKSIKEKEEAQKAQELQKTQSEVNQKPKRKKEYVTIVVKDYKKRREVFREQIREKARGPKTEGLVSDKKIQNHENRVNSQELACKRKVKLAKAIDKIQKEEEERCRER